MNLANDDWDALFNSYKHEAFRLETLPAYGVASEREEYEDFMATGQLHIPDSDSWLASIRHFRETDRWIGRVHVLTRPLSDYLRYEFEVYRHTVAAGEDVRILDLTDAVNPGLPQQDFWLFDETVVVRMDYASDGTQLGRELLDGVDPTPFVAWKQLALAHAQPFSEYCAMLDG